MKLSTLYWHRVTPLHIFLWPLSILFGLFLNLRKLCYWLELFPTVKLPVPVIVVDSITTDDSGKTPLILWLVEFLQAQGLRPGIITRGYSDNPGAPMAVTDDSNPSVIGGKTMLLAKRSGNHCPVWVGDDRVAVARALLNANPDCNIIICNDGLQYHRLERDMEIAVADFSAHSFGNGFRLPAGPLRISLDQLSNVDAVVINGKQPEYLDNADWAPTLHMKLVSETIYNISDTSNCQLASDLKDHCIQAIADLDNCEWFFDYTQQNGLNVALHSFADNHHFVPQDLQFPENETILMPEEIAIQCANFANGRVWALPIDAWVDDRLQSLVLKKLNDHINSGIALNEMAYPQCKKISD